MKKKLSFTIFHLAFSLCAMAWQGDVVIETPNTQMLLTATEGGDLRQSYYGDKSATLQQLRNAGSDLNFHALPAFGTVDAVHTPALQVQHFDGDLNLELRVTDYEVKDDARTKTHIFTMADKLMPFTVKVFYKAYKNVDVIETWTEISHQEKKAITLKRFDSGHLVLRQGDAWITHLHGNWAAETQVTSEPLTQGMKTIRNSDGTRNSHLDAPEIMLSLDGQPQELCGRTIGLALCWSGNFELRVNTISHKEHHVYAGIAQLLQRGALVAIVRLLQVAAFFCGEQHLCVRGFNGDIALPGHQRQRREEHQSSGKDFSHVFNPGFRLRFLSAKLTLFSKSAKFF